MPNHAVSLGTPKQRSKTVRDRIWLTKLFPNNLTMIADKPDALDFRANFCPTSS